MSDIDMRSCVGKTFERRGDRITITDFVDSLWMRYTFNGEPIFGSSEWLKLWLAGAVEVKGDTK